MPPKRKKHSSVSEIPTENKENKNEDVTTVLTVMRETENIHSHDRLLADLKINFYDKLSFDDFCEDFFYCCRILFISEERLRTENPLLFVVKFIIMCVQDTTNEGKGVRLFRKFVNLLYWYHTATNAMVRFHVLQVLRILLIEIKDDVEITDIIYEKMQQLVLQRLWDVKIYVRAEAAAASSRLQDPEDARCPIVIGLMHLSRYDNSQVVRLAAMQAVAITTKTLPYILHRCLDLNDSIRKKAYDLLAKWKILKPLTISKRLQIVESGLNDKVLCVRNACVNLLKVWFSLSGNDPVALLKRFDVENSEVLTRQAFDGLLINISKDEIIGLIDNLKSMMNDKNLIVLEKLNGESAFFWRHLVSFLSRSKNLDSDYMEKIIPNYNDFESYLRNLFMNPVTYKDSETEVIEAFSVNKQLMALIKFLDIFDQHNRQCVVNLIKWALSSRYVHYNYVDDLMKLLVRLESSNIKICNLAVEIINELIFNSGDVEINENEKEKSDTVVSKSDETLVEEREAMQEKCRKKNMEVAQYTVLMNELQDQIESQMRNDSGDNQAVLLMEQFNELKKKKKVAEEECKSLKEAYYQQLLPKSAHNSRNTNSSNLIDDNVMDVEDEDEKLKEADWMQPGMENLAMKATTITISMIQECKLLWNLTPSLRSLFESVILVTVQHTNILVRKNALVSMGLCCLLDKELAVDYYKVFIQSLHIDHDSIKEVAVGALVDIFIRFGIEPFQDAMLKAKTSAINDEEVKELSDNSQITFQTESETSTIRSNYTTEDYNKCTLELFNPIIVFLNNKVIQSTAALGLVKLIYNQKLFSAKLLSRLLLLWFSPETADQHKLRSQLASLFTYFCQQSEENQMALVSCFLLTIRTLSRADVESPFSQIDINTVIDFYLKITDSRVLLSNRVNISKDDGKINEAFKTIANEKNPCHDELAVVICNQILKSLQTAELKFYIPTLLKLRLSTGQNEKLRQLVELLSKVINKIKDRKAIQLLDKLHKRLQEQLVVRYSDEETDCDNDKTLINLDSSSNNGSQVQPLLLEVQSEDSQCLVKDTTMYIGSRIGHKTIRQQTRLELSDNEEMITQNMLNVSLNGNESASVDQIPEASRINESTKSQQKHDDDVFKVPKQNIRITRSSSRLLSESISSTISSVKENSISNKPANVRLSRSSNKLKK